VWHSQSWSKSTVFHVTECSFLCWQNPTIKFLKYTNPVNCDIPAYYFFVIQNHCELLKLRGAADKSLTRPTSRCRGTELLVSLERGVCSCAELSFLVTEAERKHVRRRARFQQHGDASCHQVPPPPPPARQSVIFGDGYLMELSRNSDSDWLSSLLTLLKLRVFLCFFLVYFRPSLSVRWESLLLNCGVFEPSNKQWHKNTELWADKV
jgi:hypothetical protein